MVQPTITTFKKPFIALRGDGSSGVHVAPRVLINKCRGAMNGAHESNMSFIERNRKSMRLKHYDYSLSGLYFVTICVKNREHIFGHVENKQMILNEYGKIANQNIKYIPFNFKNTNIIEYAIMPNHVHVIVEIINVGAPFMAPTNVLMVAITNGGVTGNKNPMGTGSLGEIIRFYKGRTTYQINKYKVGAMNGAPTSNVVWQRNFHDRIIRNDEEFYQIKQYINLNPENWENDEFNRG